MRYKERNTNDSPRGLVLCVFRKLKKWNFLMLLWTNHRFALTFFKIFIHEIHD